MDARRFTDTDTCPVPAVESGARRRNSDLSALLLRCMLAWTMIWAGATKVFLWHDFTGERAHTLVRLGVVGEGELDWSGAGPFDQPYFDWASHTPQYLRNEAQPPVARARNVHHVTLIAYGAARPNEAAAALAFNRHGTSHGIRAVKASEGASGWMPAFTAPLAPASAWAVSLIQLLGGVAMLLGFLTRPLAAMLCVVMLGAAWLTQIGPVLAGGAPGSFGFLPPHEGWHPHGWKTLLWQTGLAATSASVALTGAGNHSVDRLIAASRAHRAGGTELRT